MPFKKRITPLLFYMVGYPGAGKSSFAAGFAKVSGAVHLRADAIGFELFNPPTFSPRERQLVLQEMDKRTLEQFSHGRNVIYDVAANQRQTRERIRQLAYKANAVPIGIWVQTEPVLAQERLGQERQIGHHRYRAQLPPGVYEAMLRAFEKPDVPPERIIVVSGADSFEKQLYDARVQLRAMWRRWRRAMG